MFTCTGGVDCQIRLSHLEVLVLLGSKAHHILAVSRVSVWCVEICYFCLHALVVMVFFLAKSLLIKAFTFEIELLDLKALIPNWLQWLVIVVLKKLEGKKRLLSIFPCMGWGDNRWPQRDRQGPCLGGSCFALVLAMVTFGSPDKSGRAGSTWKFHK